MDVGADGMKADPAQQPKHEQNYKDSPKHKNLSFAVVVNGSRLRSRSRLPKIARRIVRHGESISPVGRIRPVADRWRIDFTIGRFS